LSLVTPAYRPRAHCAFSAVFNLCCEKDLRLQHNPAVQSPEHFSNCGNCTIFFSKLKATRRIVTFTRRRIGKIFRDHKQYPTSPIWPITLAARIDFTLRPSTTSTFQIWSHNPDRSIQTWRAPNSHLRYERFVVQPQWRSILRH
jgi:hypothetical protein